MLNFQNVLELNGNNYLEYAGITRSGNGGQGN